MNLDTEEIFNAIAEEVSYINLHWKYLTELFIDGPGERKQEILNRASPIFFDFAFHLFYDHVILKSAKLADPAIQAGSENLSIHNLISKLEPIPQEISSDIQKHLDQITSNLTSIKSHRNKRIAHNDLEARLAKQQLPQVNETEISSVINGLGELLNAISLHYFGFSRNYKASVTASCEPSHLLNILKSGVTL
ncbi:hypothetical protein [Pseudomonas sp. 2FE]|uniref:AbiU2 domain-containing protein n=1 Tax=Pseudomonas sp. 2FE TaxID=2502190 RepID=UPI0010F5EB6F|nr:hypothetical protein [Pseudomonas sp. 2FE]